jgi:hypothetical protein
MSVTADPPRSELDASLQRIPHPVSSLTAVGKHSLDLTEICRQVVERHRHVAALRSPYVG